MTTEYWLQKKSLGGWSTVTWYGAAELAVAQASFKVCVGNGLSGYSWRLCKVEVAEVVMLDEVTEIEAPEIPQKHNTDNAVEAWKKNKPELSITPAGIKGWSKAGGSWGDYSGTAMPVEKPVANGWGSEPSSPAAHSFYAKSEHGLTGSVWMINHSTKHKKRVTPDLEAEYAAQGYERGGPKTKFRE